MKEKRVAMQRATQGTGIEVSRTPNEELLVNMPADFSFDVGHTDNGGSDAINNPLSVNRANTVRDYLVMRGVPRAAAAGRTTTPASAR